MSVQNFYEPGGVYWTAPGAELHQGDVRDCLRRLPPRSVHCVVTSPPYWGLRDYGTGSRQIGLEDCLDCLGWVSRSGMQQPCGECYVCHMVEVFAEVKRVLRDDGTVWLNLGDSYGGSGSLAGIPWRVALALQADEWILRQDIIWAKPNPMPESVTNRCTKSHEYVFLLAKCSDYYYDAMAIAEESRYQWNSKRSSFGVLRAKAKNLTPQEMDRQRTQYAHKSYHPDVFKSTRNKRDVWTVSVRGYSGAHYAVFNSDLITPCILAGTSDCGACASCGKPYTRVISRLDGCPSTEQSGKCRDRSFEWSRNGKIDGHSTLEGTVAVQDAVGWRKMCGCQTDAIVPCTVLDPFVGSGTAVVTALEFGRDGIGIDLSETYLSEHAIPRIESVLYGESHSQVRSAVPAMPVCRPGTPPTVRALRTSSASDSTST